MNGLATLTAHRLDVHGVAAPPLVAEALALGIIFVLMVAAIGVGIAAKNRGGSTTGVQYAGH
jgi:hypothetical protein